MVWYVQECSTHIHHIDVPNSMYESMYQTMEAYEPSVLPFFGNGGQWSPNIGRHSVPFRSTARLLPLFARLAIFSSEN